MRWTFLLLPSLAAASPSSQAAPAAPANEAAAKAYDFSAPVGPHHRRVEKTIHTVSTNGIASQLVSRYVEVGTGLNYLDTDGQWKPSEDRVEPHPDGAAALRGQQKVVFGRNLNRRGAIRLITPEGIELKNHPLGLYYFDRASGDWAELGNIQDSIGVILPPNQVLYRDAFAGAAQADILYTYTQGRFEADVILRNRPPEPASLGLSPETTALEVVTEFPDPAEFDVRTRVHPRQPDAVLPDLTDDDTRVGSLRFLLGRAFNVADAGDLAGSHLVLKRWEHSANRKFLVESVQYSRAASDLARLLPSLAPVPARRQGQRILPTTPGSQDTSPGPMSQGESTPAARPGFVIDYATIAGTNTSYTFSANTTYRLNGDLMVYSGTCSFANGTVIKYDPGMKLIVSSGASISGSGTVFTARDDDSVGETVSGSTGTPSGTYANPAIWLSDAASAQTFSGHQFRHAAVAIRATTTTTNFQHLVTNCTILASTTALEVTSSVAPTLNAQNLTTCGVANLKGGYTGQITVSGQESCPALSSISNQTMNEDGNLDVFFTLTPPTWGLTGVTTRVNSDNSALLGTGDFWVYNETGNTKRIFIAPLPDQSGSATVSVTTRVGDVVVATRTFGLTVQAINDPTIEVRSDVFTVADLAAPPVQVILGDVETSPDSLSATVTWDSARVAEAHLEGSGPTRFLHITPQPGASTPDNASTSVNITVSDGNFGSTTVPVNLHIAPDPSNPDAPSNPLRPPGPPEFLGPCEMPLLEQYSGLRLDVPDTSDGIPAEYQGNLSDGGTEYQQLIQWPPPEYTLPVGGSPGCKYDYTVEYEAQLRDSKDPNWTPGGPTSTLAAFYDEIVIGEKVEESKLDAALPTGGHMSFVANTKSGSILGGCQAIFPFSFTARGGHFNRTLAEKIGGLKGGYLKIKRLVVTGASVVDSSCATGDCDGSSTVLGSVDQTFGLGRSLYGLRPHHARIHAPTMVTNLVSPSSLPLPVMAPGTENAYAVNGDGTRQWKHPAGLVDVRTIATNRYRIASFALASLGNGGAKDTNGLFVTGTNAPIRAFEICHPAPTNVNCLRFDQTVGASAFHVFDYLPGANGTNTWLLSRPNAFRFDRKVCVTNGSLCLETTTVAPSSNGAPVSAIRDSYEIVNSRRFLTERMQGPDTNARLATFTYVTNSASPAFGKVSRAVFASGGWQIAEYDASGRLSRLYESLGNSNPSTNAADCRRVDLGYSPLGGGDDGTYRPNSPRLQVEYLAGNEVSRRYQLHKRGELRDIVCTTPGASWSNALNLVTITRRHATNFFRDQLLSVVSPDGLLTLHSYATNATNLTRTVLSGTPDVAGTNVIDGTRTVTVVGLAGETISRHVYDVASGALTDRQLYSNYDLQLRPQRVDYLDGTFETTTYGCCGVESATDREGITTTYLYDELKRLTNSTRLGISTGYLLDALGRATNVLRVGTDGSTISTRQTAYDLAGRVISETDAAGIATTYAWSTNASGETLKTTTFAAGTAGSTTRIETFAKDGSLVRLTGTAVMPVRYVYDVESTDGIYARYRLEIKLTNDVDSAEWTKTYTDMAGRQYKTVHASASGTHVAYSTFDSLGRLARQVDPDGVSSLRQYNAGSEPEVTATLLATNATSIDFTRDRITRVVSDILTNNAFGFGVRRSRTWVCDTDASGASNLVSTTESSLDALRSWTTANGLTSSSVTTTNIGGYRYVTNTAPDATRTVSMSYGGRVQSVTRFDTNGVQTGATTYEYDAHGRQWKLTDARNGTTIYAYDNADRVVSVTSPGLGNGEGPQTTLTQYDAYGRPTVITHPDGTTVTNEYHSTGLLKKTSGSRTYPVEYAYDSQGRMKTMKTWRDFAGNSGTSTTTWNYDAYRGFLSSKRYADNYGPDYTYTAGGRLKTRTWARNHSGGSRIQTTYKYGFDDATANNDHADVVEVSYNDSVTPTVTTTYDRLGRARSVSSGTNTLTRFWASNGGQVGEAWTAGVLVGHHLTNSFDAVLRRSTLTAKNGATTLGSALTYTFDSGGRLQKVDDGAFSTTYGYLPNSPLWGTLEFKNGATLRATTTRQFDALNRLQSINTAPTGSGVQPVSSGYAYNRANQRTRRSEADGTYWVYDYDSLGQVISGKKFWADGTPVPGQHFEYGFDDIGNRKSAKEGGNENGLALRSASYTANSLNQYSSRTFPNAIDVIGLATPSANATVNGTTPYRRGEYFRSELTITNASNPVATPITAVVGAGGTTNTTSGFVLSPPATQTLSYDLDGNLTNDLVWSYTWDGENRLLSVETLGTVANAARSRVSWDYDAAGRRVRQTVSTNWTGSAYSSTIATLYLYDGWACVAELSSTGTFQRQYAWGLDLSGTPTGAGGVGGLLWMRPSGGAAHFAAFDGNGNVAGLIDGSDGTVSARYDYDVFGQTIRLTGAMAKDNAFRFSTKRTDATTGLVLYEYRAYSPSMGKWPNRDPIGERGEANLYGFNLGDPIGRVDSDGAASVATPAGQAVLVETLVLDEIAAAMKVSTAEVLKRISLCASIHETYKALACKGCGAGCFTVSQAQGRAACLATEVGLRGTYLRLKCDYFLPGSIGRGSAVAEKGHQIQLAEKLAALAKCTAKAIP